MAEFRFYLKDPKAKVKTAIILSISAYNSRAKFYTNKNIHPDSWCTDPKKKTGYQRAIRSSSFLNAPEFNTALDAIMYKAKVIDQTLLNELGRLPTANEIKEALTKALRPEIQPATKTKGVFEYWQETAENIIHRTNSKTKKPITKHTRISLLQTLRILKEYSQKENLKLDWSSFSISFYEAFKVHLEKDLILSGNTVAKHLANLKFMIGDAESKGYEVNAAYRSEEFRATKEEPEAIYLNEIELQQLEDLDLTHRPGLAAVRDMFLIGCWTGLRFGDFTQLDKAKFDIKSISIETRKTRKSVVIPILPPLARILSKYKTPNGYQLPKAISNQKMNEALKELGQMLPSLNEDFTINTTKGGLEVSVKKKKWELLVTHTARRSYATNLFKRNISPKIIMDITGHASEKQFYSYIKMTPEQSSDKVWELWHEKEPSKAIS